jgi:hypothetical protein
VQLSENELVFPLSIILSSRSTHSASFPASLAEEMQQVNGINVSQQILSKVMGWFWSLVFFCRLRFVSGVYFRSAKRLQDKK